MVLAEQQVWVAVSGDRLLVLDAAKEAGPSGLSLHVFARNDRARLFSESAGFTLVEQRDGSGNEGREPDCSYSWPLRTVGCARSRGAAAKWRCTVRAEGATVPVNDRL